VTTATGATRTRVARPSLPSMLLNEMRARTIDGGIGRNTRSDGKTSDQGETARRPPPNSTNP